MTDSSAMNEIPGPRPGGAGWLWLVFACAIAAYLPTAFVHTTWGNDESRIVEVARQMSEYDHPLVPHLRGEVYSEKPPALYWMISATHAVVGDWALAGHLVVAFFVALCGMVVAALGALLLESRRLGLVGGLVFLTLATVVMRAHFVLLDPVMTTWVLAAVLFLLLAARTGGRRRFGWALAAALASAGACMTKGPAAQLHIAMGTIVTGLVLSRRRSVAWGPLVFALAFGFGVTLLWVRLAANEVGPWFWDRMSSSSRADGSAPKRRTPGRSTTTCTHC